MTDRQRFERADSAATQATIVLRLSKRFAHPCLWALLLFVPLAGRAEAQAPQWRGFWVDTFNTRLNTPGDTALVVARAAAAHANAVFVQVRRRGDAWYLDALEPLPDGVPIESDFDPLRTIVAQAHDAGIEVHAFVSVGAIWNQTVLPASPAHVFAQHGMTPAGSLVPGRANWLTRTFVADTGTAISYGGHRFGADFWIDPGHPDAAAYTAAVLAHLVSHYDIDGLHLDRIRYPDLAIAGQSVDSGASVGYNPVSLERFRRRYALPADAIPLPNDPRWNVWRRDQVTALVRRLYLETVALKPRVTISTAVVAFGDAPPGSDAWESSEAMWRVFQDWRAWAAEGIVDLIVPMIYRPEHTAAGAESFGGWVAWSRSQTSGRPVAIGIGSYLNAVEGTLRQVRRATEATAAGTLSGVVFFSMGAHNAPVVQNTLAVGDHRDTPYRSFDDLAAGLTTGRTTAGQALESGNGRSVFAAPAPVPVPTSKAAPSAGHLKGVITSGGLAADGAEVSLEAVEGNLIVLARSDGNGFYGRPHLPPGDYRVLVAPLGDGVYRSACRVAIAAGEIATLDLDVDPARPAVAACLAR